MRAPEAHGNASALWLVAPGRAEIRPAQALPPGAGEVRLRSIVSGVSRGTESLVFHGRVPPGEWSRMRCPFQEGDFPFPVKYGYALVGEVEDGPAEWVGRRVFCLHPHQTRLTVPLAAVLPIPDLVTSERAALAAQMETALNATWDAGVAIGDRVAVVGGGAIGCLVAYLCGRIAATAVTLIDSDDGRRTVAEALGIAFAQADQELAEGCDIVFHASGTASGLNRALALAGYEAEIVELSWYGTEQVQIDLGGPFHSRRLTLRASQVGAVAPARRARWDNRRRLELALEICADPRLDVLTDDATPFERLPDELPRILGRSGALLHLVRYSDR